MNANSKHWEPDMISLEFVEPSPPNQVDPCGGHGEGKEAGGVTVCEDDDDGVVVCVSEDGTTVE